MKTRMLCAVAAVTLAVGCAQVRQHMGASADNDQNVLTGGPVSGTTIKDLPQAVKDALKQKVPTAEIADIDKRTQNSQVVYRITFSEPNKNPAMYIGADGSVVQNLQSQKPSTETEGK